jgi:hypothetical protein
MPAFVRDRVVRATTACTEHARDGAGDSSRGEISARIDPSTYSSSGTVDPEPGGL